jgi:hypothetical protein
MAVVARSGPCVPVHVFRSMRSGSCVPIHAFRSMRFGPKQCPPYPVVAETLILRLIVRLVLHIPVEVANYMAGAAQYTHYIVLYTYINHARSAMGQPIASILSIAPASLANTELAPVSQTALQAGTLAGSV